jgi:hypothetical protein
MAHGTLIVRCVHINEVAHTTCFHRCIHAVACPRTPRNAIAQHTLAWDTDAGPLALVRDPWSGGTPPRRGWPYEKTVSCLVGGYMYNEIEYASPDDQAGRQSGMAPAPYPFESNVIATSGGVSVEVHGSCSARSAHARRFVHVKLNDRSR